MGSTTTLVFIVFISLYLSLVYSQKPFYCQAPLPNPSVNTNGMTLKMVQVLTRHGDRTPLYSTLKSNMDVWNCTLGFYLNPSQNSQQQQLTDVDRIFRKVYLPGRNYFPGNCSTGQLTSVGYEQHLALGQMLRTLYVDKYQLLSPTLDLSEIYVRSTDVPRTVQSAQGHINGLYPPETNGGVSAITVMNIFTMDSYFENMYPNPALCPELGLLMTNATKSPTYINFQNQNQQLQTQIMQALGVSVFPGWSSFMDLFFATQCHDFQLPEGITEAMVTSTYNAAFFDNSYKIAAPLTSRLAMSTLLEEVILNIRNFIEGTASYKYYIFSGHDDTLGPFVNMFGLYKIWPAYASHIEIELWQDDNGANYIQFKYNGESYVLNGCPNEMCPIDQFFELAYSIMVPDYIDACNSTTTTTTTTTTTKTSTRLDASLLNIDNREEQDFLTNSVQDKIDCIVQTKWREYKKCGQNLNSFNEDPDKQRKLCKNDRPLREKSNLYSFLSAPLDDDDDYEEDIKFEELNLNIKHSKCYNSEYTSELFDELLENLKNINFNDNSNNNSNNNQENNSTIPVGGNKNHGEFDLSDSDSDSDYDDQDDKDKEGNNNKSNKKNDRHKKKMSFNNNKIESKNITDLINDKDKEKEKYDEPIKPNSIPPLEPKPTKKPPPPTNLNDTKPPPPPNESCNINSKCLNDDSKRISHEGWDPIKFKIEKSFPDERNCKNPGDKVLMGSKVYSPDTICNISAGIEQNCFYICEENDVVDEKFIDFIYKGILPTATQIFSSMLLVENAGNPFYLDRNVWLSLRKTCGLDIIINETYVKDANGTKQPGIIGGYNFLLMVTTRPILKPNSVAYAKPCNFHPVEGKPGLFNRPLAGSINFSPETYRKHLCRNGGHITPQIFKKYVRIALHEMIHLLGFEPHLFPSFVDPRGHSHKETLRNITIYGTNPSGVPVSKNTTFLVTPQLTQAVRNHFGCNDTIGMELESLQDLSHFETRILQGELMVANLNPNMYFSIFTLALLQDTGWYIIDPSYRQNYLFGKNQGCKFLTGRCEHWSKNYFCNDATQLGCSSDRRSINKCFVYSDDDQLHPFYQHFTDPKKRGYKSADYCPTFEVSYRPRVWKGGPGGTDYCSTKKKPTDDSSTELKCFVATFPHLQNKAEPQCFEQKCVGDKLYLFIEKLSYECPTLGGNVNVTITNTDNSTNYILVNCPNSIEFCKTLELEKIVVLGHNIDGDNSKAWKTPLYWIPLGGAIILGCALFVIIYFYRKVSRANKASRLKETDSGDLSMTEFYPPTQDPTKTPQEPTKTSEEPTKAPEESTKAPEEPTKTPEIPHTKTPNP
eukprot:gene787-978_t